MPYINKAYVAGSGAGEKVDMVRKSDRPHQRKPTNPDYTAGSDLDQDEDIQTGNQVVRHLAEGSQGSVAALTAAMKKTSQPRMSTETPLASAVDVDSSTELDASQDELNTSNIKSYDLNDIDAKKYRRMMFKFVVDSKARDLQILEGQKNIKARLNNIENALSRGGGLIQHQEGEQPVVPIETDLPVNGWKEFHELEEELTSITKQKFLVSAATILFITVAKADLFSTFLRKLGNIDYAHKQWTLELKVQIYW